MKLVCSALMFLLLADHVSYVHMIKCTSHGDCTATGNVLASCGGGGQCDCSPSSLIPTEEGCVAQEKRPTVSLGDHSRSAVAGSQLVFLCEGETYEPNATYIWYSQNKIVTGWTSKMYTIRATRSSWMECGIVSSVPGLSSPKSDLNFWGFFEDGQNIPNPSQPLQVKVTVTPLHAAVGTPFTASCTNLPMGTVPQFDINNVPAPNGQSNTSDPQVGVRCLPVVDSSISPFPSIDFDLMSHTILSPTVTDNIMSISITSSPAITGLAAFRTTETPNLTCTIYPPEENLPSSLTFTYNWNRPIGPISVTTREWKIPATPASYINITCDVNNMTSPTISFIIDDNYISVPNVTITPLNRVLVNSKVLITCDSDDQGVTYAWTANGEVIPGQFDSQIQYTELKVSKHLTDFRCTVTKDGFSQTSEITTLHVLDTLPTPYITGDLGLTIDEDSTYTLTCNSAEGAYLALNYLWEFNGVLMIHIMTASFTVSSAVTTEAGNYSCSTNYLTLTSDSEPTLLTVHRILRAVVVTSSPSISSDMAYRTTDTMPTLTCNTNPLPSLLPSAPNFTWAGISDTTRTWTIPAVEAIHDAIRCSANGNFSEVFHTITIDDNYISVPNISQNPVRLYKSGTMVLTCNSDDQGVTYKWFVNGAEIGGQINSTVQASNLPSSVHLLNFSCIVTKDGFSQTSQIITIFLFDTLPMPDITGELTIDEDSTLNLTCNSAEGAYLPLTYEWKLNDNQISSATETVYTVDSVATSQAGNYTCSTTYFNLTTESAPVLLTVHRIVRSVGISSSPNITSDMVYKTTDTMPILACETTPDPSLLSSVPIYTWAGISDTTRTWTIPAVEAIHDAIRCSANGNFSEVFYTITIDNNYINVPSISQTPASQHYTEDVNLTCSTNSPGVTYSWSKDGVVVPAESGSTFMLTNIRASDVISKFSCITTKNFYSQVSANYSLSVKNTLATPRVNGTLQVVKNETITLICNSEDEIDALTYQWWRNGAPIGGGTNKIITFQASDNGEYKCATNLLHLTATSAAITVEVKTTLATPTITGTTMTTVGGNLSMTCSSTDSEISNIVYTLTRDGNDVQTDASPVYSIVGITSNETTSFTCRTSAGALASDESEPATVVIIANLATPYVAGDNTVVEGDTLRLTCNSNDNLPLTYTWAKNGQQIPSATGQTYTLPNFQAGNGGNYTCKTEFRNLDSDMSPEHLVEYVVPGRPCTSGDDCPNEEKSLTGICVLTTQRCICAEGYSAYLDYCNGVPNLVGSTLIIVAMYFGIHFL